MLFAVYDVWTSKPRYVEADSINDALEKSEPEPRTDLNLCNWHAVPCEPEKMPVEAIVEEHTGALNYRQIVEPVLEEPPSGPALRLTLDK